MSPIGRIGSRLSTILLLIGLVAVLTVVLNGADPQVRQQNPPPAPKFDIIPDFQAPAFPGPATRPEQQLTEHDRSAVFSSTGAPPSSTALNNQPEQGQFKGFDFGRDPLDAKHPMQTLQEIMQEDMKN